MVDQSFIMDDPREAAIAEFLGGEGAVIWRDDLPWHPGHPGLDRYAAGVAPGPDGAEFFLASARRCMDGIERTAIHLQVPVAGLCRPEGPEGVGEVGLGVSNTHDGAFVMEMSGMELAACVARSTTVATGVFVVRTRSHAQPDRLAVVVSRFVEKGRALADVVMSVRCDELALAAAEAYPELHAPTA